MSISDIIEHKKLLINQFNKNDIIFTGSIFTNNIRMQYKDCYPREIIVLFYYNHTNNYITDSNIIDFLYNRLRLKLYIQDIDYIEYNYITIYKNNYKVYFAQEDTYGDINNPIMLNNNEIYKLLLY